MYRVRAEIPRCIEPRIERESGMCTSGGKGSGSSEYPVSIVPDGGDGPSHPSPILAAESLVIVIAIKSQAGAEIYTWLEWKCVRIWSWLDINLPIYRQMN